MGRKILAIILTTIIVTWTIFSTVVQASVFDSGTCGANTSWTMDYNGTLTISGAGNMYDYSTGTVSLGGISPTWQTHKDIIEHIHTGDDVTSIGSRAFYQYNAIENVTFGTNLKSIGSYAFYNCVNLKNIKSSYSLVSIGECAFMWCKSLKSVSLPSSVKRIDTKAFYECTSLEKIEIGIGLERIDAEAFAKCNNLIVYYAGSEEQWNKIYISPKNNDGILNAKIIFNYKEDNDDTPTNNCILIYDANGGIEPPIPVTVKNGEAITVSTEKLSRIGYEFLGWSKQSSAVKAEYIGDENLTLTGDLTLYAVWKKIGGYSVEMVLTIDSNNAKINGTDAYTDVAPIIENSRTMLPARFVAEKLGASVTWDDAARKVIITGADGTVIEITIDSATALVNGKEVALDAPAFIRDSRTYTPVRFICDNLGADVGWDGEKREVTIRK